jgi:hypothetical protein
MTFETNVTEAIVVILVSYTWGYVLGVVTSYWKRRA